MFTGILMLYHTFLISTNQTTWEHIKHHNISYMKIYKYGTLPFSYGIFKNFKIVLFHGKFALFTHFLNLGGKVREWKLRDPRLIQQTQGYNICMNEDFVC